ncbi:MAG: GAF domain-containing protein [Anaerolineales bacterium]|nr:GAF domain-containing protein [Anaerolineales bacterium]
MISTPVVFTGYAIIGLTLFILAAATAVYLLHMPEKSAATRYFIGFFVLIAFSGIAMVLTNAFLRGGSFFAPWQDLFVLASGIFLTQFAYAFPDNDRSPERRAALMILGSLTLLGLVYTLYFDYRFLFLWHTDPDASDAYYLLLPISLSLGTLIFLRRSIYHSRRAETELQARSWGHYLLSPRGNVARALRNMALALSLAFLPGLQTLLHLPYPYSFVLSNIGALLAVTAITLVYFNHATEEYSFTAKLVGITLATVLLIFSVVGTIEYYQAQQEVGWVRKAAIQRVYEQLMAYGRLVTTEPDVAYVVSWDDTAPAEATAYRLIFQNAAAATFDLRQLIAENVPEYLDVWSRATSSPFAQAAEHPWRYVSRIRNSPSFDNGSDYEGYIFVDEGTAYEIGFSPATGVGAAGRVALQWMGLIALSSGVVLLVFPAFFRNALVRPLASLLAGVKRVNEGKLDTAVPVRFNDEIGYLTLSFNNLTDTLRYAKTRQQELIAQLQNSYEDLEKQVALRTRELSAFTDLTMLSGEEDTLENILQPALTHIMEVGLCEALGVHLLAEEQNVLELVAYRFLPPTAVAAMSSIPLSAAHFSQLKKADEPILIIQKSQSEPSVLPHKLLLPPFQAYLGCPLTAGDQTLGWLSCYRQNYKFFNLGEMSLLVALARQLGVLVENQRLHARIQQVAAYEERKRLARDLHDSVTQLLYSMTLFTRSSQEALEDGDMSRLEMSLGLLSDSSLQALREMRFMLFELQPPSVTELGLVEALNIRFDMVESRLGARVLFAADDYSAAAPEIEHELYYVAVEALNNSLKYAAADQIQLRLCRDDEAVYLTVTDNGRGFEPSQVSYGLGLPGMRHRINRLGGKLQIESAPNAGTRIAATVPLAERLLRAAARGEVHTYE